MTDARLEALEAELVTMVETYNDKITETQRYLAGLIEEAQTRINQQRGRIAEREFMMQENAGVLDGLDTETANRTTTKPPLFRDAIPLHPNAIIDEREKGQA